MTAPLPRPTGQPAYAPVWVRRDQRPVIPVREAAGDDYRPVFFRPYRRTVTPVEPWPRD